MYNFIKRMRKAGQVNDTRLKSYFDAGFIDQKQYNEILAIKTA